MEASARSSLTFLEQLAVFHRQQKGPKATIPIIDGKTVDLWRLRKNVNELGGYRSVSFSRRPYALLLLKSAYKGVEHAQMASCGKNDWL